MKAYAVNKAFRAKPMHLHVVIADVMKMFADPWGPTPSVALSTNACWVLGDHIQLAQVLSNLVRNGMEATEGQTERRISATSHLRNDSTVEIRVEDNGPGIPPPILSKLFSPFSGSKADGLGVGLSICKAIIERHGGKIWPERLDGGTALCFSVPCAPHKYKHKQVKATAAN